MVEGVTNIREGRGRLLRCVLLLTALVAGVIFLTPASAVALPPYEGLLSFGEIDGPDDPEQFSWEVTLGEGQELKQVDDQHAAVYHEDDVHVAFVIAAEKAHDAIGTTVPTSLSVSGSNVVTLNVHHRAGNPVANGALFDYPIVAGEGWDGGFQPHRVVGPPDEEQVRTERQRREAEERNRFEALEGCRVPKLEGRSLKASAKRLAGGGCKLGKVRGKRARGAKVVKQDVRIGTVLPTGSRVSIKLG
ncbi:MAG TPA: hypothetical protein VN240_05365 [Propylenella sp.]|nr:hypothetical protein [Propylenella sp.]